MSVMDMVRKMLVFTSSNRSSDHPQIHGNDAFHSLISLERLMRIRGTPIPALGNYFGYRESRCQLQPPSCTTPDPLSNNFVQNIHPHSHSRGCGSFLQHTVKWTSKLQHHRIISQPWLQRTSATQPTMLTTCKLPSFFISFLRSRCLEMRKLAF
jgi:hypothetical protein